MTFIKINNLLIEGPELMEEDFYLANVYDKELNIPVDCIGMKGWQLLERIQVEDDNTVYVDGTKFDNKYLVAIRTIDGESITEKCRGQREALYNLERVICLQIARRKEQLKKK